MKIQKKKKKSSKKLFFIIPGVILVAILITGAYLYATNSSLLGWTPFPKEQSSQVTPSDGVDTDNPVGEKDGSGNNQTTDQVPINEEITATFTDLSQSNGVVKFSGSVTDSQGGGTCSIVFTNPNDRPITRSYAATLSSGKATCRPIEIPETEFSALGEWTATFRYYTDNTQAVVERTINIQ